MQSKVIKTDFSTNFEIMVSFPYLFMMFEFGKIPPQQWGLKISVQPREFSHYNTGRGEHLINSIVEAEFRIQSQTRSDLEELEGSWKQGQLGALQGFLFLGTDLQKKKN